jgi:hypothetical protein
METKNSTRVVSFWSGSNHAGEIAGLALGGQDLGVTAPDLTESAIVALEQLAGTTTRVFLDSGAFNEVEFTAAGPQVVRPISDAEWDRRLALYVRLARALGAQLFAVAPDQIGNQDATLARLAQFRGAVDAVRALGANVLVPLQGGARSLADFDAAVSEVLGCTDYVRAVPMKKGTTPTAAIVALLADRPIARLHLLGLGPSAASWDAIVDAIRAAAPAVELFADSCRLKALVGRGSGVRPLTRIQDEIREELEPEAWYEIEGTDYTDAIADPAAWMTPSMLRAFADAVAIADLGGRAELLRDPSAWLQEDDRYLHPVVEQALDAAWLEFTVGTVRDGRLRGGDVSTTLRKRESLVRLCAEQEIEKIAADYERRVNE